MQLYNQSLLCEAARYVEKMSAVVFCAVVTCRVHFDLYESNSNNSAPECQ